MAINNSTSTGTTTTTSTATLHYRRNHPGGGALGRCSYGVPGVPGIVVFDVSLFANGIPPATLTLPGVVLAQPQARKVAGVTSAVVAGANVAQAQAQGTAIAPPATVAAVVAQGATAVVATAQAQGKGKGHKAKVG